MTIDEKVGETLSELGVTDAVGVAALFAEVRAAMESERRVLVARVASSNHERDQWCKTLRDRWLARKNGIFAHMDEKWLKPATKDIKPEVGREFNRLRAAAAYMEIEELIKEVPVLILPSSDDIGQSGYRPQARNLGPGTEIAESILPPKLMPDPNDLVQQNQPNREAKELPFAVRDAAGLVEPILPPKLKPNPDDLVRQEVVVHEKGTTVTGTVGSVGVTTTHDLSLPGLRRPLGSIHPVMRVQREIEDIFLGLGFKIETGPEIESVYYNFDALNIPDNHPSRDDFDTIYIDTQTLLRTHTSPVQIRAMEKWVKEGSQGGLYIITPGKCYRNDNPDATHSPMFHQMEGLAIDTDITFADLKGTLDFFARKFFGEKTRTSFHPTFFPFTEPSGEVAVSCYVCGGAGCRTCKESGWIELMGCGMVHPQVLKNGGIDPEKYSGWAFGLGIDRFTMARYGINDIQLFFQGDVRFLEQF